MHCWLLLFTDRQRRGLRTLHKLVRKGSAALSIDFVGVLQRVHRCPRCAAACPSASPMRSGVHIRALDAAPCAHRFPRCGAACASVRSMRARVCALRRPWAANAQPCAGMRRLCARLWRRGCRCGALCKGGCCQGRAVCPLAPEVAEKNQQCRSHDGTGTLGGPASVLLVGRPTPQQICQLSVTTDSMWAAGKAVQAPGQYSRTPRSMPPGRFKSAPFRLAGQPPQRSGAKPVNSTGRSGSTRKAHRPSPFWNRSSRTTCTPRRRVNTETVTLHSSGRRIATW